MASLLLILATLLISSIFTIIFIFISNKKKKTNKAPLPPGPTGWPIVGNLLQLGSKPHETLHDLSKIYGPLYRLKLGSVTFVIANSADVASQFLRTHDANFSNRPPNTFGDHMAYNHKGPAFVPYGPRWRMIRRLSNTHLFSTKALDDLRQVREEEVAMLARKFVQAKDTSVSVGVEVGKELNACAANALTRALFRRRVFEEDNGPDVGEFRKVLDEVLKLATALSVEDFIPWVKALDLRGFGSKLKKLHRWYDDTLTKIVEEHKTRPKIANEGEAEGKDFLSVLLALKEADTKDEETDNKLTDTDIKALLTVLFTGGTDTTSSTVEWALVELIRHPDILAAAQKELDSIVGRSRLVSELDLNNIPVLQAIIKETFRLHPPVPLLIPHTASEACEVAGYHIPKAATLLVNTWTICRDPDVWSRPLEFDHSRFLPAQKHADVDVKGSHFELIPFGTGRRICLGMRLGLRMTTFLLASLVHGFDWALPDGLTPETLNLDVEFGLTLERSVPLVARPIPRLDHEAYAA
ncbi:LOW QUALITY PROTEIN: flavonoid 3'-monooxygenase CYP75B137-like [Dioscorea cayenensis subsp. rotundata]|uniref:LOW QUALITY PROTEIN: flavonoid 3'-monooxygenase CYP75B137-like n=1 Tax=Dioscorea cayennensis subsp. rotundata TaxID=55577 RepID=A0AB40CE66_DIOCR|nr:LOW QUALITY PROTEIN: flavonoid 3'-monooxygenase CYP75B137-like [Dioscorea cayenensis subsp. rotundata]